MSCLSKHECSVFFTYSLSPPHGLSIPCPKLHFRATLASKTYEKPINSFADLYASGEKMYVGRRMLTWFGATFGKSVLEAPREIYKNVLANLEEQTYGLEGRSISKSLFDKIIKSM